MIIATQQQREKHAELKEIPRPQVDSMHQFHIISEQLDDSIQDLQMHASMLTLEQSQSLHRLLTVADGIPEFTVTEIDRQYHLFIKMQEQVATFDGQLRATASVRDIAAVISSMGSLISLFLKAQNQLDSIKAEADLKEAILDALRVLPAESQAVFFERLAELEGK